VNLVDGSQTVFAAECRSWYKLGKEAGRNVALWPGSSSHAARALQHPRWEDYNYEYLDNTRNRFYWLGDGSTYNEKYMTGDRRCLCCSLVGLVPMPFVQRRSVISSTQAHGIWEMTN
jgi:hypothetical protein